MITKVSHESRMREGVEGKTMDVGGKGREAYFGTDGEMTSSRPVSTVYYLCSSLRYYASIR